MHLYMIGLFLLYLCVLSGGEFPFCKFLVSDLIGICSLRLNDTIKIYCSNHPFHSLVCSQHTMHQFNHCRWYQILETSKTCFLNIKTTASAAASTKRIHYFLFQRLVCLNHLNDFCFCPKFKEVVHWIQKYSMIDSTFLYWVRWIGSLA